MNEKQKKDIIKALGKEGFEAVENIVDSHGINRKLIETKNLKTNTDLALATLKKLKNDFWQNVLFIIIGAVLGYFPTFYQSSTNENKMIEVIKLLNKQSLEKERKYYNYQTDVRQMRFELSSIKKELDSLKSEK
jgi:hypothetical protein